MLNTARLKLPLFLCTHVCAKCSLLQFLWLMLSTWTASLYAEDGDRFSCIVIQLYAKEEPVKVNWMMGPTYMHNYLSKFCSVLDYSSWTTSVQSITFWIVKRKRRDKPRVWIMDRSLLQASFKLSARSMLFYLQQEWSGEYICPWHWSEWMTCQWRLRVSV